MTLGAFAKPSTHRYVTRPLSTLSITVVKQMERVTLDEIHKVPSKSSKTIQTVPDVRDVYSTDPSFEILSFAGCGVVTVKRNVHG